MARAGALLGVGALLVIAILAFVGHIVVVDFSFVSDL